VQANVVFAETPIRGGEARENLTGAMEMVAEYLEHPFGSLGEMRLYQGQVSCAPRKLG